VWSRERDRGDYVEGRREAEVYDMSVRGKGDDSDEMR